ncbi:hypothetical protein VQ056_16790 [Paenibacillus sp. JTLBN-2024]
MQEVLYEQLEDLQALLPEYGWIGVGQGGRRQRRRVFLHLLSQTKAQAAAPGYLLAVGASGGTGFAWLGRRLQKDRDMG